MFLACWPILAQCTSGNALTVQEPVAIAAAAVPDSGEARSLASSKDLFVSVAKLAKASVVNISAARKVAKPGTPRNPFFDDPFFRRFFGEEFEGRSPLPRDRREQG